VAREIYRLNDAQGEQVILSVGAMGSVIIESTGATSISLTIQQAREFWTAFAYALAVADVRLPDGCECSPVTPATKRCDGNMMRCHGSIRAWQGAHRAAETQPGPASAEPAKRP
jgi:hypothetical protein